MKSLKIIQPGILTTVQDYGRIGYGQFGVPAAGVMDRLSMELANILVGNDRKEAVLEMTMMGPTLEAKSNIVIAITGANMNPKVNGNEVNMYETIYLNKGDILELSYTENGCRAYMAVYGGFDLPVIMGSKSTYLRAKIGGNNGEKIKANDILNINEAKNKYIGTRKIPRKKIPSYSNELTLRVILGPEEDYFTKEGIDTFLNSEYVLTKQWDRMGLRFDGPQIKHKDGADIISNGINFGAIQIPGHGRPIIMMADRQTTGGYTKIANIISVDLPYVAQLKTGNRVRFESITIDEAHELIKVQEKGVDQLISDFNLKSVDIVGPCRDFKVKLRKESYNLSVQEIK